MDTVSGYVVKTYGDFSDARANAQIGVAFRGVGHGKPNQVVGPSIGLAMRLPALVE